MAMLGQHLHDTGQLRPELDRDKVRDVLWNYLAIDHYECLVMARRWDRQHYTRWLTAAVVRALCP
jgi:hypothetical protein